MLVVRNMKNVLPLKRLCLYGHLPYSGGAVCLGASIALRSVLSGRAATDLIARRRSCFIGALPAHLLSSISSAYASSLCPTNRLRSLKPTTLFDTVNLTL